MKKRADSESRASRKIYKKVCQSGFNNPSIYSMSTLQLEVLRKKMKLPLIFTR